MSLCVQGTREGNCLPGKVATCWLCDLHFNMQLQHCTVWACKCYKWAVSDSPCSKQAWICFTFDITKLCAFCPFWINFLITYRWVPPSASCPMASHCLSGSQLRVMLGSGFGNSGTQCALLWWDGSRSCFRSSKYWRVNCSTLNFCNITFSEEGQRKSWNNFLKLWELFLKPKQKVTLQFFPASF